MTTQQTKVGLDYRRFTESKQATAASNQLMSATSTSISGAPNLRTTTRIPSANLTRSISSTSRNDKQSTQNLGIIAFKQGKNPDRSVSKPSYLNQDSSVTATASISASTSVLARGPNRTLRKPQLEPSLKHMATQRRDANATEKRLPTKRGAELSAEDIHGAHPLSREEKLAARQRAEVLHAHILNPVDVTVSEMPEPKTYEYPVRSENPLYKSRIQTKLVTEAHIPTARGELAPPSSNVGIDASVEAAIPPSVLTKSCAIVTELINNPYAGISVENLLTEMTKLETELKREEKSHKEIVAAMQQQLNEDQEKFLHFERQIADKTENIQEYRNKLVSAEQIMTDMTQERAALSNTIQSLNESIDSLRREIETLVAAGKKQEEKHIAEISDIKEAMQNAMESIHRKDKEKLQLQDQLQALEGTLGETRQQLMASTSEADYIRTELMELSEKMKTHVLIEKDLRERLSNKEAELAQLQEEVHRHNSDKAIKEFGKSAASLLTAIMSVDFSSQVDFSTELQLKENEFLKEHIKSLEEQLLNYKTTYDGVRVVPSENGDILQNNNNIDVRVLPCEHCNRNIDFVQTMLDLVDLRKVETEWMIDTEATKAENAKLKAALLELGRRYKALQLSAAKENIKPQPGSAVFSTEDESRTLGDDTMTVFGLHGEARDPDEENKTLNFTYLRTS